MEEKKYRILVVDDEDDICEILQYNLSAHYIVDTANSAEEAIYKLAGNYDLVLLDIMMDGISGLKLAELLRKDFNNDIPIIFISALDKQDDILNGFRKGCDDYISKPFSIKEVLARVKAVLSRYKSSAVIHQDSLDKQENKDGDDIFVYNNLKIDFTNKRVFIENQEVFITRKENDILELLTKNVNKIYSREDILKLVWKDETYVLERTVDVHIARLRKKMGVYGDLIINRSGYGYCFQKK